MKRRSLTVLLCLLAIISLASVGFASWVISAGDEEVATGNIQVETVSDQRLEIVLDETTKNQSFNFLAPATQTTPNHWLTAGVTESKGEKLDVTLKFTVSYKDSLNTKDPKPTVTVEWDAATLAKLNAAVENGYIKQVPSKENDGIKVVKNEKSYTATITFVWGSAFGNDNPYTFYNSKNVNDGYYTKEGAIVGYKETTDTTTKYFNASHVEQPNEPEGDFISWGNDAANKLDALYKFFTVTEDGGTIVPVKYGIKITAKPAA